ncbi:MAG TPA: rhomboid family intramembrane serine protease [Candidatus Eisenbacteria bacterium]|nr:rhomboid family intramembrane serine protease [Candidatus Eisenbacteria bacterium]
MTFCNTCGREVAVGTVCPYCGAHNPAPKPSATSGSAAGLLLPRHEISATHVIVGLNLLVFAAMVLTGASALSPSREQLLRWGANWGPLSLGAQPWRMLTSNYVHVGIIHLGFNMWCLWNLGQLAERVLGRLNYVILYTFCGLAGSLASLWWHPMTVGAGASGAIFGLAGAAIAVFYMGHLPVARAAMQGTLRSLLTFVGYNLLFGLSPGIDNSAHIGGLVAGLAMGAALSKHILVPHEVRRTWARLTWIAMAVVLFAANGAIRRQYPHMSLLANPQVIAAQQVASARRALQQRRPDEAVALLQDAIEQQPKSAEPRYLLGAAYLMQRQPDQAIAAFQEALRLDPEYAEAAAGLGTAYMAKGMKAEAQEAFKKAEELGYNGDEQ